MTQLDHIAEILADGIELADDTAEKLHSHMNAFRQTPTWQRLMRTPGFSKLWEGIAEAVDRAGGFETNTDLTP